MVTEIVEDLPTMPDAIFCCVGGGGLLGGVLEGCSKNGWEKGEIPFKPWHAFLTSNIVPVIALETHGSACFAHAMSINTGGWLHELPNDLASVTHDDQHDVKVAHLKELKSTASSLGATAASAGVIRKALDYPGGVICGTIPDELAMNTALRFAGNYEVFSVSGQAC